MIWPLGRQGPAATLRQRCPQMTQRPGMPAIDSGVKLNLETESGLKLIISSLYALLFDCWNW